MTLTTERLQEHIFPDNAGQRINKGVGECMGDQQFNIQHICEKISALNGARFEELTKAILAEAGFHNVVKQSAGSQGGFDIKGTYENVEWRFEAKWKKKDALSENDLAAKFDQIERDPGLTEYFILFTNATLGNDLRKSIDAHRSKWLIDLDYWSLCNGKFINLLISYPEAVIKELELSDSDAVLLRDHSKQLRRNEGPFLNTELSALAMSSNRFKLLQSVATSISDLHVSKIRPQTDYVQLVQRESADVEYERYIEANISSAFFLVAREQMGKSNQLRLWANRANSENIVLFFTANEICCHNWLDKLQMAVFREIERISTTKPLKYLSTIFSNIQPCLQRKKAAIFIFVDALNTALYEDVRDFFRSNDYLRSSVDWRVNWFFSCREANWKEWKQLLDIDAAYEYTLQEFTNEELDSALIAYKLDIKDIPHWMRPKLRWPGLLRLCGKMLLEQPDVFKSMPEMALAEISLKFIKDRLDEFAQLHPCATPMKPEGVEVYINDLLSLFQKQKYRTLPFKYIKEIEDFNPHHLSQNSWNILLQQGFLTKKQEGYELGNDWGCILIGKYLIDQIARNDVNEGKIETLLDQIFDGIAPIVGDKGGIRVDESERFEEILWFALHYGKILDISELSFTLILDRTFAGQNLSHESISLIAAQLFPSYTLRYFLKLNDQSHVSHYLRKGLEKVPSGDAIPELITFFPNTSDEIKLHIAILLLHYNDRRFLADVYALINTDAFKWNQAERKILELLENHPDDSCQIIKSRFADKSLKNLDLALFFIGLNGDSTCQHLVQEIVKLAPTINATSLRSMGQLRIEEAEEVAIDILLNDKADSEMKHAAIDALGHLRSKRFYDWCRMQLDLGSRDYYGRVIRALELFENDAAHDLIVELELKQEKWIPFIFSSSTVLCRKMNKERFIRMVTGIIHNIRFSEAPEHIWRGLHNMTSLDCKTFKPWWEEYQSTKVPHIIADLARLCAKPEHFNKLSQTEGSMCMKEALKLLKWIGDTKILIGLLYDLMEKKIPELFAWHLYPYVNQYPDQSYKDLLFEMAKQTTSDNDNISEQVQRKAIICLTHLQGGDVADIILKLRPDSWTKEDFKYSSSLAHFRNESLLSELIEILNLQKEELFWSAYCYIWEFLPEQAIKPALIWLKSDNCKPTVRNYLMRLLGRYDNPEINTKLLVFLQNKETEIAALDALFYSTDERVISFFMKQIEHYGKCKLEISTETDSDKHHLLIDWIRCHNYAHSKPYIQSWLKSNEVNWLPARWLILPLYEIINKFSFWDLLEDVKKKYYAWNSLWGPQVIEATLELIFAREPEWAWNEFLKYWSEASETYRKDAIKWVYFMPSKASTEWLINIYPSIGNFFSDEKEIRKSIHRTMFNLADDLKEYGIRSLMERSRSESLQQRIHSAQCTSLFGEDVYNHFHFLEDDTCARVRLAYRYATISELALYEQD
ncbi:MAG: hypothetical protein NDI77_06880 [Geobacteraceae bacterium]|nr:hypothetical protein [Geobacteraceae bacterium]